MTPIKQPTWRDRVPFWRRIVERTHAKSCLDVGCGRGDSMRALRSIGVDLEVSGVDVNLGALREAQAAGLDVADGPIERLAYLLPQPGTEHLERPRYRIADLVSLTASIKLFDAEGYAKALAALDDASSHWVLLIDLEPMFPQDKMAAATKALIQYAKRRLRLDQTGVAEGFGVPAYFSLMEQTR